MRVRHFVIQEPRPGALRRFSGERSRNRVLTYRVRELRAAGEYSNAVIERRNGGRWEPLDEKVIQSSIGWGYAVTLARQRVRKLHPNAKRLSVSA